MLLSSLKPVVCGIAPANGPNGSYPKMPKVKMVNRQALPPLQVKEQEKPMVRESSTVASRREMMHLTAASLGLASLLLSGPAEARARNASIREKIMEKFEELRRKAGLSKPKDEAEAKKPEDEAQENKPKDKVENRSPPKPKEESEKPKPKLNDGSENKKPTNEELPVPVLPNILNDKLVETTLP